MGRVLSAGDGAHGSEEFEGYLAALRELEASAADLCALGRRIEAVARSAQVHVVAGNPVSDVPSLLHLEDLRSQIDTSFARFNQARQTTRLLTAVLGVGEGTSLAELARRLGVSRQHLSKLVREHEDGALRGG